MRDVETSRLDDRHKVLFRLIDRVNHDSPRMRSDDFAPARAAGWTDDELYFAVTVCALFNFYNRWIDATGVHALSDEAHREGGRRSAALERQAESKQWIRAFERFNDARLLSDFGQLNQNCQDSRSRNCLTNCTI